MAEEWTEATMADRPPTESEVFGALRQCFDPCCREKGISAVDMGLIESVAVAGGEAFWNFELPEEIVQGCGCGQLTAQAKRKILGENLARLHGMNVTAKKQQLGLSSRALGE